MLPEVTAIRYVTPLREGGSLPGLMEADDLGTYVVKFRGAGQGPKALVAEVIAGQLARALDLPVPALAIVHLDPVLAANEPDDEVQHLLRASGGRNLGVDFLPGALDLDAGAFAVDPLLAGRVLWFDALVGNVDRSWRNPNLLLWHRRPYLIDHGAALTFHHRWSTAADAGETAAARPYDAGEHVLLGSAPDLDAADAALAGRVDAATVAAAVADVPDDWLTQEAGFASRTDVRRAYREHLLARVSARDRWLPGLREAVAAGPRRTTRTGRPEWLS